MARRSVFVSYASEHHRIAEHIALAIRELNVDVFLDRDKLQPGHGYHEKIHSEIEKCEVFVFLLSNESIRPDRYTMSELQFAREKWPNPDGHVLTVPIAEYQKTELPPYLGATTFVSTVGNIPTNVRARVKRLIEDHVSSEKRATGLMRTLGTFLQVGVGKTAAYANSDDVTRILDRKMSDGGGRIFVGDLKEELDKHDVPAQPHWVVVDGVFFPGALMSIGWWRRSNKQLIKVKWNDPSWQGWLFSGFEQWAPSWDINDWMVDSPINLVAQLGARDEADSIPILVKSPRKAAKIRDELADQVVLNAYVRGLLCHENHFPQLHLNDNERGFFEVVKDMTESQYYILVFDDDDSRNEVEFRRQKVDFYSGYLWQCWSPKEWTPSNPFNTQLPGAYFVWEHTNLADRDVVRFGLDSLDAKLAFLRRRLQAKDLSGELVLLQHLMPDQRLHADVQKTVEPAIPIEQFTKLFGGEEGPGSG